MSQVVEEFKEAINRSDIENRKILKRRAAMELTVKDYLEVLNHYNKVMAECRVKVMKPKDAAEHCKSRGLNITAQTISDGLKQGRLHFGDGDMIPTVYANPVFHINPNELDKWIDGYMYIANRLEPD